MRHSRNYMTTLETTGHTRRWSALIVAIMAIGVLLRLYYFFVNRSLWLDEAMLALNITTRSAAGLMKPLDFVQGAPLAFLLAEKLAVTLFGNGEYALRIFPLASGLFTLPFVLLVGLRYGDRWRALIMLSLFALSNHLIYYSSEAKQYAGDVFWCCVLLAVGWHLLQTKIDPRDTVVFGLVAAMSIWFSHAAIFGIATIYCVALFKLAAHRNTDDLRRLLISALLPFLSIGVLYFSSLKDLTENDVLLGFWSFAFMPMPPWEDWGWFRWMLDSFFIKPVGITSWLAKILFAIGMVHLLWRRRDYGAVFTLPYVLVLLASAFRIYPVADRMVLFLAPMAYFSMAEAIMWIGSLMPRPALRGFVAGTLTFLLLIPVLKVDLQTIRNPYTREHMRPTMRFIQQHDQPEDEYYGYVTAFPIFKYYAPRFGIPADQIIEGKYFGEFPETSLSEFDRLRGHARVWFIISRPYRTPNQNDEDTIIAYLDGLGRRLDEFQEYGVSAYLYDLN